MATWFKDKATDLISGTKKAADRILRHKKGYESLQDPSAPSKEKIHSPVCKKTSKKTRSPVTLLKLKSNYIKLGEGDDLDVTAEDDPFGDMAEKSTLYTHVSGSKSFSSFILKDGDDELSLPMGSYVVSYHDQDTVITAAVSGMEDANEVPDLMSAPPLAQFTPMVEGWQLRRKKAFSHLKDEPKLLPEVELILPLYNERANLSVLMEVDSEEEELEPTVFGISFSDTARDSGKPHRVIKKTARSNLRAAGGGVAKKYGKKTTKSVNRETDLSPFDDIHESEAVVEA